MGRKRVVIIVNTKHNGISRIGKTETESTSSTEEISGKGWRSGTGGPEFFHKALELANGFNSICVRWKVNVRPTYRLDA
jgi:hypothetical protein